MNFRNIFQVFSALAVASLADTKVFTPKIVNTYPEVEGYAISIVDENALVITKGEDTLSTVVTTDGIWKDSDSGNFVGALTKHLVRNYLRFFDETYGSSYIVHDMGIEDGYLTRGASVTNGSWWWANTTFSYPDGTASGFADVHPVGSYVAYEKAMKKGYADGGFVFQIRAVDSDGNAIDDFTSVLVDDVTIETKDNDLDTMLSSVETIYGGYTSSDLLENIKTLIEDLLTYFYNCEDESFGDTLIAQGSTDYSADGSLYSEVANRVTALIRDVDVMGSALWSYETYLEFSIERTFLGVTDAIENASSSEVNKAKSLISDLSETLHNSNASCLSLSSSSSTSTTSSYSCVPEVTTSLATSTWETMQWMTMSGDTAGMWMMMPTTSTITFVSTIGCDSSSSSVISSFSSGYSNTTSTDTSSQIDSGREIVTTTEPNGQSAVATVVTVTSCSDDECSTGYITTVYTTTCPTESESAALAEDNSADTNDNAGVATETETVCDGGCNKETTEVTSAAAETSTLATEASSSVVAITTYTGAAAKLTAVGSSLILAILAFVF